jgi:acetylornithine deacetylase/succinyl-diaminopimelate desuccinylase-like protein
MGVQDGAMTQRESYSPEAEVVEICQDLIRHDSSNFGDGQGPGERSTAEHVATLLEDVGIHTEVYESAPGRTTLVARWGDHSRGNALLVHGHLDVVPALAGDWQVDPFSGEIRDGYIWGRGAIDMKDFDAMILSVVRARTRVDAVPERPIVLCFTADEESGGGQGAHWLADNHPEALEGCTEAIGEVGGHSVTINGQRLYLVETAEKGMCWLRLRAKGTAGHGSMLHPDNAVTALSEAVARIGRHEWPVQLTDTMTALFTEVGDLTGDDPSDHEAMLRLFGVSGRMLGASIRNISNPTMLESGYKLNVVPGEAVAYIDGRYLPGTKDEFLATVQTLLGEQVSIEPVHDDIALEVPFEGDLVGAMRTSLLEHDPGARVAPYLMPGGTDSKAWSKLGITGYGFSPLRLPADLDFSALFHGVDERVPIDGLEFGARVLDRFLDLA